MIDVSVSGLDKLEAGLESAPEVIGAANLKATRLSTLLVEAEAKRRVRRRSGRLFSSISSEVTGDALAPVGRVYTDVEYAPVVEHGSAAHEIVAHGQALMLPISPMAGGQGSPFGGARLSGSPRSGQQVAFFKSVHHPGTKAMPFMRPALDENVDRITAQYQAAMDGALEAVAHG